MTDKTWMVYNGADGDLDWFATKEEAEDHIKMYSY